MSQSELREILLLDAVRSVLHDARTKEDGISHETYQKCFKAVVLYEDDDVMGRSAEELKAWAKDVW